jgi:hypothetical protein
MHRMAEPHQLQIEDNASVGPDAGEADPLIGGVVGSTVSATTGGIATAAGAGCVVSGIALTATGILAPVGIALIIGGVVGGVLGVGATVGGVRGIQAFRNGPRQRRN